MRCQGKHHQQYLNYPLFIPIEIMNDLKKLENELYQYKNLYEEASEKNTELQEMAIISQK